MTFSRKNAKRKWKNEVKVAVVFVIFFLFSICANAAGMNVRQYQKTFSIGGRISATVILLGYEKDAVDIQKLLTIVTSKAIDAHARFDWQNPASEVAKLNETAGGEGMDVSDDILAAFHAALKVAGWTGGAFDIAAYGAGNYRDIKVEGNTVRLKRRGMQLRFDDIAEGFLADVMIRYIRALGMQNAIIKVGSVFRGMGAGLNGPWKIEVRDDAGTFAHRALDLAVGDTGVATVSANEYRAQGILDPRSKKWMGPACRGVTIVMDDAAPAQALANAVFVLGPKDGYDLLVKLGAAKGLIVDNAGNFLRSPEF